MFELMRNMTIGQAWGWCKTAMLFVTPATIVWATAWPIVWSVVIAPAIAQVAEETMADNIADLQAAIDKISSGQAGVGQDSREGAVRSKYLEDLLRFSLCIQVNPGNVAACGAQPEPPR